MTHVWLVDLVRGAFPTTFSPTERNPGTSTWSSASENPVETTKKILVDYKHNPVDYKSRLQTEM